MRVRRGLQLWWRPVAVPLVLWLLAVLAGSGAVLWQQDNTRRAVANRFGSGVSVLGQLMTGVVADELAGERVQSQLSLSDPVVSSRDFDRVAVGFGFTSAVLIDAHGRVIRNYPDRPSIVGQVLTDRYAHLRTALQGTPVVSGVVLNAAQGTPVAAFAVPFETTSGRRVFSGAIPIRASPLALYFSTALSLTGSRVQMVDSGGNIVAATDTFDIDNPSLARQNSPLAVALNRHPAGRYRTGGTWWRYSSAGIPGTPWRVSAAVTEKVLFASTFDNEITGRVALVGAALVGLAVVVVAGRARAHRRDLLLSERRFRKVFDGSRIGMLLTDSEGRCLRVNAAAGQIFGRAETEVLGRLVEDFTHPGDAGRSAGARQECLAGPGDGFDLDIRYVRPDGEIVEASTTNAVLRDEKGRPLYLATQIIDTTEQRAHERDRAVHAQQLQDANTHLADVMAMLSHDVRQPLAKIVGLGGLLHEEWNAIPEHTKVGYVQRITAAGHRASDLVTDILTLAQVDAGAITARPARIDIAHAVREAVGAHQVSAGTPISVIAPDETTGLADPSQLQLILGNLLTNAAKYGRPPIEVTVVNTGEQVEIRVADHGEGVPPEFVPHLFDRFSRADSGVATTTAGTGLGLYLVRQLAQAGGLDIAYQPGHPTGATFTITVPRTSPTTRHRTPDPDMATPSP